MPRPMAGDAAGTDGNTFVYPAEDPAQNDYLIMSVGVLGAASAGFCLILLVCAMSLGWEGAVFLVQRTLVVTPTHRRVETNSYLI